MRLNTLAILIMFLIISCEKGSNDEIDESDFIIKYGRYSGWCAGDDSLTISANNLYYVSYSPCDENKQVIKQNLMSDNEKKELLSSIDLTKFKMIELNSCNVCVDGTDYWISIRSGSYYHRIRYGYGDSLSFNKITGFIKQLDIQKAKFN
jgi:hypothetical protein